MAVLWENAELLAEHGVIYPRLGRVSGHHGLVFDWARLPPVYALPDGSRGTLAKLSERYAGEPVTVFLSSEEFSRGDPAAAVDFGEVRSLLSEFDEIEVVCTLRPQWEFVQSVYLEISKHRCPPRPPVLIRSALETGMVEGLWVDYLKLLDRLEETFAPEEITLVDFASARAAPGGILGEMLRLLGCDLAVGDLAVVNGGSSNVSPMPMASWAANILSEPARANPWLIDLIGEAITAEMPKVVGSCLFTREEIKQFEEHFGPINAELEARRGGIQPGFRLSRARPPAGTLVRNGVPPSLWVQIARREALIVNQMLAESANLG